MLVLVLQCWKEEDEQGWEMSSVREAVAWKRGVVITHGTTAGNTQYCCLLDKKQFNSTCLLNIKNVNATLLWSKYTNKGELKIFFVYVAILPKKPLCRPYWSLQSRQDGIRNWDTASILSSTKWVILGCITSALHALHSGLLVPILKATLNPISEMAETTLELSFWWRTLPDFIPNLDVATCMKTVWSWEETLQQVHLVDLAHRIPWHFLHQQQVCRNAVRYHVLPVTNTAVNTVELVSL